MGDLLTHLAAFFSFRTDVPWDGGMSFLRVTVGAFLVLGLFSTVRHGVNQLRFRSVEGPSGRPQVLDLRSAAPGEGPARGHVAVTGYPLAQPVHTFVDVHAPSLPATDWSYLVLGPGPAGAEAGAPGRLVVVRRAQAATAARPEPPPMPDPRAPVTIRGVAGYPTHHLPGHVAKQVRALGPEAEVLVVLEGAPPPPVRRILMWWVPVTLLFLFGLALLWHWFVLVKRQVL